MNRDYFVTTSVPYVNARPHIGHALELIQADALARYLRLTGANVTLQTGTDENAHKNVAAAEDLGVTVQDLVDENAGKFRDLTRALNVDPDSFIRTTELRHRRGVRKLWESIASGDIYRRSYRGLYCEGCEDFLLSRDLVGGRCVDHLLPPTEVEESNYFFRLSRYQDRIERIIESDTITIYPPERKREVLAFVRSGLQDISVSRDARRMSGWGIAVPGDPSQVIYVWIDALINYISGIGYGSGASWRQVWNDQTCKVHVIGKNVWKFHAVYWPALLFSAGLPVPNQILVHGFLTAEGRKISKSLGNTVDPIDELSLLGCDALRLYLLSLSTVADGDYSRSALIRSYNRQMAARLGSTATRVTALCERFGVRSLRFDPKPAVAETFHGAMEQFRLDRAIDELMKSLDRVNAEIAEIRPWEDGIETRRVVVKLEQWARTVFAVGYWLQAFAPSSGVRVCSVLACEPILKPAALFPRTAHER